MAELQRRRAAAVSRLDSVEATRVHRELHQLQIANTTVLTFATFRLALLNNLMPKTAIVHVQATEAEMASLAKELN
jgi:hypothetical protein